MIENPILKGFCPDPSIIRVGDDYYIAVSTFEWWPGVRLFHSKDLKNWQQLPSPLQRKSQLDMKGNLNNCGVWAPCLSWCDGTFFLVYSDVKTQKRPYYNTHNYLIYTDDIRGEWSEPVYLNSTGFDASLFHDGDKKYLLNMLNGFKGILIQEYDHHTHSLVGEIQNIFPGTELGFTEGPHLYCHDEYYYLLMAEGGTSYGHCVTIAHSKSLFGPYEVDPLNPMLTSRNNPEAYLQKAGHADIVQTQNGEWYMVHLCARPLDASSHLCVLGRETAIQKVEWVDGWLRLSSGGSLPQQYVQEPDGLQETPYPPLPCRDDFNCDKLGLQYSFLRVPIEDRISLGARAGWLRIFGKESITSNHCVSLVAHKQEKHRCIVETAMDFTPEWSEQAAGLVYMYNNENFYWIIKTLDDSGQETLNIHRCEQRVFTTMAEIPLSGKGTVFMRLECEDLSAQFFYSLNGLDWQKAGDQLDASIITDEKAPGFTGAHFALYCHDMTGQNHYADFDYLTINT